MNFITRLIAVSFAFLFVLSCLATFPAPALADGVSNGWSWDECWNNGTTVDADNDYLHDHCETAIAWAFSPRMWYEAKETDKRWYSHWAVEPTGNYRQVKIFYALSYYRDSGRAGITAHDGDSEFIVVEANYSDFSRKWFLNRIFLSAHYKAPSDHSNWFPAWQVRFVDDNYKGRPEVWASRNKHANYISESACDNAAFWDGAKWLTEVCGNASIQYPNTDHSRNLGNSMYHLTDAVRHNGVYEWYWSDPGTHEFCGWQREWWQRNNDCSTSYRSHIQEFEDDVLGD